MHDPVIVLVPLDWPISAPLAFMVAVIWLYVATEPLRLAFPPSVPPRSDADDIDDINLPTPLMDAEALEDVDILTRSALDDCSSRFALKDDAVLIEV